MRGIQKRRIPTARTLAVFAAAGILIGATAESAQAQQTVTVRSGVVNVSGAPAGSNNQISTNGGAFAARSNTTVTTSASYTGTGTNAAALGALATPGGTYVGNGNAVVVVGTTNNYQGIVPGTAGVSPFTDGSGPAAYYVLTTPFTISALTFTVSGSMRADNGIFDAILDYGTAAQQTLTTNLNTVNAPGGNAFRTTGNVPSSVIFSGTGTGSGSHTLSLVFYNNSGPANASFEFTAVAAPEPGTLPLVAAGVVTLPLAGLICRRRTKRA